MSIRKLLNMAAAASRVVIMGQPEITDIMDSDNKPYYACKLKGLITVRCSVDKNILPYETDEVLLRESALEDDSLEIVFINGKDDVDGWYIKDWVADYSKGQQAVVYQSESIRDWVKGNRSSSSDQRVADINKKIEDAAAKRKAEAALPKTDESKAESVANPVESKAGSGTPRGGRRSPK